MKKDKYTWPSKGIASDTELNIKLRFHMTDEDWSFYISSGEIRPVSARKLRPRVNPVSSARLDWLTQYGEAKNVYTPDRCARCARKGKGWKEHGGDFEPHHVFRRSTLWRLLCFIPLCPECHVEVEHNSAQARLDGWIVDPVEKGARQ